MPELNTIVCIDDEPDILELIKLSLSSVGHFNVLGFQDGPTAIAALGTLSTDLILVDGMMPAMTGMQALKEIRKIERHKNTPIIFMTARIRQEEKKEYYDLGACGVIEKPFDPMVLSETVQTLWNKATEPGLS